MARRINPDLEEIENSTDTMVNPLRNEKVTIHHIYKKSILFDGKDHVLSGGKAETSKDVFVLPQLANGTFVNPLTNVEKAYLEDALGVGENGLSIYKKENNFWSNSNAAAVVTLTKNDTILDLSDPDDYIKYKILLANKNRICPSMSELEQHPRASYEYVIVHHEDELDDKKNRMTNTMECYMQFGKVNEDADTLRCIIELINQRPLAPKTKISWLQTTCNELIQNNPKQFLSVIKDPLLPTKVFIKKCVEAGLISTRNKRYYIRKDNQPMCNADEESTFHVAARWLNEPIHQEIKLALEHSLNTAEGK